MNPDKHDFERVILSGVIASAVLTVLMYLAPVARLPGIDMASAIGTPFAGHISLVWSPTWWLGLFLFLLVGIAISPTLFLYTGPFLYGSGWVRGMQWGFLIWTVGGIVAMTFLGLGFHEPHVSHPVMTSLTSFAGHLVYGAVLGALAPPIAVHTPSPASHAGL